MHIHIHQSRRHINKHHTSRMTARWQQICISAFDSSEQQTIAHGTPIHIKKQTRRCWTMSRRKSCKSPHTHIGIVSKKGNGIRDKGLAKHLSDPLSQGLIRVRCFSHRIIEQRHMIARQTKPHIGMRQGHTFHQIGNGTGFGAISF